MATKTFCDRCNEEIKITLDHPEFKVVIKDSDGLATPGDYDPVDLCRKCSNDLVDFMRPAKQAARR